MVGSSCLDRKATAQCEGPVGWIRAPVTTPIFSYVKGADWGVLEEGGLEAAEIEKKEGQ